MAVHLANCRSHLSSCTRSNQAWVVSGRDKTHKRSVTVTASIWLKVLVARTHDELTSVDARRRGHLEKQALGWHSLTVSHKSRLEHQADLLVDSIGEAESRTVDSRQVHSWPSTSCC